MVKGFEHLSDAQLEHYGTENVAVISDDAQRIAAHLEECADCRSRVLEHQRARFGFMANSMNASAPATACVPEDDLRDFAAGVTTGDSDGDKAKSQAKALAITQHVAQCPLCARILRTFAEHFSDDLTPEELAAEKEMLGQLKSSSPHWQKDMASHAMKANRNAASSSARGEAPAIKGSISTLRPTRTGGWFPRWILAPAALAACAAIAFAVWFTQRDTPEKVEKLLAQAYTEQRTIEMRWPGAEHAELKLTRSGESTSILNSPEALRKAASEISSHLKQSPDDPTWLVLSAQLELLGWHYKPGLLTLEKINDQKTVESREFLMTRALLLSEKAESEANAAPVYGQVVETLSKVLEKNPNDAVALFNRALACEKLSARECASSDWQRLVNGEVDPSWSEEANRHLRNLQEKKKPAR